jgi:hypothetical protein
VIVNALGLQFHEGLEPSRYGRPGRVPGHWLSGQQEGIGISFSPAPRKTFD